MIRCEISQGSFVVSYLRSHDNSLSQWEKPLHIDMAECKTALTPVHQRWSYYSLALSHLCNVIWISWDHSCVAWDDLKKKVDFSYFDRGKKYLKSIEFQNSVVNFLISSHSYTLQWGHKSIMAPQIIENLTVCSTVHSRSQQRKLKFCSTGPWWGAYQWYVLTHDAPRMCRWIGLLLVQVMSCACLVPSHYLTQYWLMSKYTHFVPRKWIWIRVR